MLVLAGCSESPDEPEKPGEPELPATPEISIRQADIKGTWVFEGSGYGNVDYVSFDGKGNGMYAVAADQYHWETYKGANDERRVFGLVRFTYTIEGGDIIVVTDDETYDFVIKVRAIENSEINCIFPPSVASHHRFSFFDEDPEWFVNSGPASEDLVAPYVGAYANESGTYRLNVSRINNYTVVVENVNNNKSTKGHLAWYQWAKYDYMSLMSASDFSDWAGYHFYPDGSIKVGNRVYHKIDEDENVLAGTAWKGYVDDKNMELSFKSNGTFIETCNGDANTYTYKVNGSTLEVEEGCIIHNNFGNPINFELTSQNKKLRIYNRLGSWQFTRK